MPGLRDFFQQSGYAIHRSALRLERLPACCRGNLTDCGGGIRHLDRSGNEIRLPLKQCAVCGKRYAVCGEQFLPIDNPLRFDMTE